MDALLVCSAPFQALCRRLAQQVGHVQHALGDPFGIAHAGAALLTPSIIPVALGVAILSTALPYTLEMVALTRMPARTFGTLMSIEPAVGALSGLLFLHEFLSLSQWMAILCIILASVGATMTMGSAAKPAVAAD